MKQAHDMANGEKALKELIEALSLDSDSWNEADTRHRFIDGLIHEVLGWDRAIIPANHSRAYEC